MERMPRGAQGSGPNLTDIILRVAAMTVCAKGDSSAADDKPVLPACLFTIYFLQLLTYLMHYLTWQLCGQIMDVLLFV